eukprot:1316221-Amphidinium_carterae.1
MDAVLRPTPGTKLEDVLPAIERWERDQREYSSERPKWWNYKWWNCEICILWVAGVVLIPSFRLPQIECTP